LPGGKVNEQSVNGHFLSITFFSLTRFLCNLTIPASLQFSRFNVSRVGGKE
jgi:hypothetical protein